LSVVLISDKFFSESEFSPNLLYEESISDIVETASYGEHFGVKKYQVVYIDDVT
jgi:hypothetical protein